MYRVVATAVGAALGFMAVSSMAAPVKPRFLVIPAKAKPVVPVPAAQFGSAITPLPSWSYDVKDGLSGHHYKGLILGQDIHAASKGVTTLPTQIIPLVLTLNDGTTTVTYNPAVHDSCDQNLAAVDVVAGSPLFRNSKWTMNGVHIGSTQYIDAFQRAEFWHTVGGSNYHLRLSPTVMPASKLKFGPANTTNDSSGCTPEGETDIDALDSALQKLITGPLASTVNPGTFPVFILKNVILNFEGADCCAAGYHSAFRNSDGQLQVYAVSDFDSTGFYNNDTYFVAHEMAETINDPTGGNPTPPWAATCQDNLEVADPAGAFMPEIVMHGYTYDLPELAYFGWFYHLKYGGAGRVYSDMGTLTTYATVYCE